MTTNVRRFLENLTQEEYIQRLELALQGTLLGIWDWDLRDNSVNFDQRWCEMLGLEHASTPMQLSTWDALVHPDDKAQAYEDINRHIRGETEVYVNIHRLRHADGSYRYILDRGRLSGWDESGKPIRFTGTHLDVTATEEAKALLAGEHRLFLELITELPAAVAMLDTELRYIAVSSKWLNSYGLTENVIGKTHYEVFPDIPEHWRREHQRALRGESLKNERDLFERADGARIWLRWALKPWRHPDASIGGIIMMTEDITKEVETAAVIEHSSRMVALGEMASGISHEINNPLTIINGKLEILKLKLQEGKTDPGDLVADINLVLSTSDRIARIVQGMKKLSRESTLAPQEKVRLAGIIDDTLLLCKNRFIMAGVDLRVKVTEVEVRCNPIQISQILLNLLHNALDAVKALPAPWVAIEVRSGAGHTDLFVRDSGPGISPKMAQKIFEPFFTTKPPGQGTGLGLSVSRTLAEVNRAQLTIDATDAHTSFLLQFPLAD